MIYIYFFQIGACGPIKIGRAVKPERRLKAIQGCCPWPIRSLGHIAGAENHELAIHSLLAEFRMEGEWFRPEARVLDTVQKALAGELHLESHPACRLDEIFQPFGGTLNLAKAIKVTPGHVVTMKQRGSIPVKYWSAITRAAKRRNLSGITVEKLVDLHIQKKTAP